MNEDLNLEVVSGIPPDRIVESYRERKLDSLSDTELFRGAAHVISKPKVELSSFRVHAPLEVMARYSLLSLVSPADRELARIQMVATVAHYESRGESVSPPTRKLPSMRPEEAVAELRRALQQGDVELADALCVRLADDCGLHSLLDSLGDLCMQTLSGAAHTHIGLMLMARMWNEVGPSGLSLARTGLRALAQEPQLNLRPVTRHDTLENPEKDLELRLSKVPAIPSNKLSFGIQGMLQAAEKAGLVDQIVGDAVLSGENLESCEGALRAVCRISAYSMLADSQEVAKYGWTHCLTIPQAAWALTRSLPGLSFARQAAHSATTWVIGHRASLGNGDLNLQLQFPEPAWELSDALARSSSAAASAAWHASADERPAIVRRLATEAAIRSDAHLVKYTGACLDAALQDSQHANLFHAAAAYLCSIWCRGEPRERILETLDVVRSHMDQPFAQPSPRR
jgi:hypothetical protein